MRNKLPFFILFLFVLDPASVWSQNRINGINFNQTDPNIYALIIAKNNQVIKKEFYNGYSDSSLFNDQSLTKNICSLLIGIAVEQHFINSADQKLSDFFPELKIASDKRKQMVTLRQVMNQASGLYHEDLTNVYSYLSDPNPSQSVITNGMVNDPGKEWHYNNAASHLLSVVISKATGMNTKEFAERYLFMPMGISHFKWAKMRDGYYDGSGLLSIRLRAADLLKLGLMISNNGVYKQKQIVPAKWIDQLLHPNTTYKANWGFSNSDYALTWYHAAYRGLRFTYGMGWGGQFLILIPSLKAVIVINQNTADATAIKSSDMIINHLFPIICSILIEPKTVNEE